jgi:hypothetical protein
MIDVEEAVYFLMSSARFENEGSEIKVSWVKEGQTVATGKFKNDSGTVTLKIENREQVFKAREAARLRNLGVLQAAN